MTLKVAIFGVVHAYHSLLGVTRGPMEKVVVDLETSPNCYIKRIFPIAISLLCYLIPIGSLISIATIAISIITKDTVKDNPSGRTLPKT